MIENKEILFLFHQKCTETLTDDQREYIAEMLMTDINFVQQWDNLEKEAASIGVPAFLAKIDSLEKLNQLKKKLIEMKIHKK